MCSKTLCLYLVYHFYLVSQSNWQCKHALRVALHVSSFFQRLTYDLERLHHFLNLTKQTAVVLHIIHPESNFINKHCMYCVLCSCAFQDV